MRTEEKIFCRLVLLVTSVCACPMQKFSLATSEKCEWKQGLDVERCDIFSPACRYASSIGSGKFSYKRDDSSSTVAHIAK